mgnify:FL=1
MTKLITIVVPTYNEELNVRNVCDRVTAIMKEHLSNYAYEILFVDNCSLDSTREVIRRLSDEDPHVKAIFNARNFGYVRNVFYAISQAKGDCAFLLHADLQNPPEMLVDFVKYWEEGYKVIVGVKKSSRESKLLFAFKKAYYKFMNKISDVEMIEQLTDFGLYDKGFIEVLRSLDDPVPYFKGIVSELGYQMKTVDFVQNDRENGKSFTNFFKSYDYAMLGITTYTKIIRAASWIGAILGMICLAIAIITFLSKVLGWQDFPTGIAAICIGTFFIGAVQMFFLGILCEYVMCINTRMLHRPLVIEEERIRY